MSRTTDVVPKDRNQGKNQLRVGRLVKAHGLKGGLKLELYTDNPAGRFTPGAGFTVQVPEASPWHGKDITVREYRLMNGNPVVFFEDVDDRESAESLVKAILWIDQDVDEVEDDAWFDHQLVGLDVVRDDAVIGRVIRVEHFPAQDLLIVKSGDTEVMVALRGRHRPHRRRLGRSSDRDAAARTLRGAPRRRGCRAAVGLGRRSP